MKRLILVAALAVVSQGAFANISVSHQEQLKLADGGGNKCFVRAFKATRPTTEQKEQAKAVHENLKQVFEDNKQAMQDAGKAFMEVMMKHPIPMEDAVTAAHGLGDAVHPLQAAVFTGTITVINLLTEEQRGVFNRTMYRCMKRD